MNQSKNLILWTFPGLVHNIWDRLLDYSANPILGYWEWDLTILGNYCDKQKAKPDIARILSEWLHWGFFFLGGGGTVPSAPPPPPSLTPKLTTQEPWYSLYFLWKVLSSFILRIEPFPNSLPPALNPSDQSTAATPSTASQRQDEACM